MDINKVINDYLKHCKKEKLFDKQHQEYFAADFPSHGELEEILLSEPFDKSVIDFENCPDFSLHVVLNALDTFYKSKTYYDYAQCMYTAMKDGRVGVYSDMVELFKKIDDADIEIASILFADYMDHPSIELDVLNITDISKDEFFDMLFPHGKYDYLAYKQKDKLREKVILLMGSFSDLYSIATLIVDGLIEYDNIINLDDDTFEILVFNELIKFNDPTKYNTIPISIMDCFKLYKNPFYIDYNKIVDFITTYDFNTAHSCTQILTESNTTVNLCFTGKQLNKLKLYDLELHKFLTILYQFYHGTKRISYNIDGSYEFMWLRFQSNTFMKSVYSNNMKYKNSIVSCGYTFSELEERLAELLYISNKIVL